jgi:hypothetical protein
MMQIKTCLLIGLALWSTMSPSAKPANREDDTKSRSVATPATGRPRLIIMADMRNEPDEEQQQLHLLICSNEIQLEGLIAVTGLFLRPDAKEESKQRLHPELFHRLIDGYAKVHPNLQIHATGWHTPEYLHSIVATGQTA